MSAQVNFYIKFNTITWSEISLFLRPWFTTSHSLLNIFHKLEIHINTEFKRGRCQMSNDMFPSKTSQQES